MKLITAVIQPHRLEAVKSALKENGVRGMTVTQASGYGRQLGHTEVYRGAQFTVDLVAKIRLEILIADGEEEMVTAAIVAAAYTGNVGDGKVWSMPVGNVTRVRTGEQGPVAL
ncbi:P-II family nitrogen regulator [Jonesiaceae bacterium BS-20]|uniref:P-II family nitrogen regulator n=1 Tax=Jonesiaceae bacterium BS-20 TaxID=3120821 RepID=A0AAU7DWE6_9MICO